MLPLIWSAVLIKHKTNCVPILDKSSKLVFNQVGAPLDTPNVELFLNYATFLRIRPSIFAFLLSSYKNNCFPSSTSKKMLSFWFGLACISSQFFSGILYIILRSTLERKSAAALTEPRTCAILKLNGCATSFACQNIAGIAFPSKNRATDFFSVRAHAVLIASRQMRAKKRIVLCLTKVLSGTLTIGFFRQRKSFHQTFLVRRFLVRYECSVLVYIHSWRTKRHVWSLHLSWLRVAFQEGYVSGQIYKPYSVPSLLNWMTLLIQLFLWWAILLAKVGEYDEFIRELSEYWFWSFVRSRDSVARRLPVFQENLNLPRNSLFLRICGEIAKPSSSNCLTLQWKISVIYFICALTNFSKTTSFLRVGTVPSLAANHVSCTR